MHDIVAPILKCIHPQYLCIYGFLECTIWLRNTGINIFVLLFILILLERVKKRKSKFCTDHKKSCMYYMSLSSKRYPKHST